jgi:hypothetical protein
MYTFLRTHKLCVFYIKTEGCLQQFETMRAMTAYYQTLLHSTARSIWAKLGENLKNGKATPKAPHHMQYISCTPSGRI